ncbi:MAG: Maf family nucleotide pyrophosphatase [Bacteroidota bacterium]
MNIERLNPNLKGYRFILASGSPRRKTLLEQLGLPFSVSVRPVEETFPEGLTPGETAIFLAEKKASAFPAMDIPEKTIVITSDTVVAVHDQVLGKPADEREAAKMLWQLSGRAHEVITGVYLKSQTKKVHFGISTKVHFKNLSEAEIAYYVQNYSPLDKAGAYGIQEWIGLAAIERIEGSYFNVVGLPVHALYEQLLKW